MIFNSEQIKKLLAKNPPTQNNSIVPSAVFLARSDKCKNEREYLEELANQAPATKQKDWIDRISHEDERDHLSSWFEIMLYGWLKQLGDVEIEPEIDRKRPDFCMNLQGIKVFFEARVRIETNHSSKKVTLSVNKGLFPMVFARFLDSGELKSLLLEKITKYKNIYKLGYGYILCILPSVWNDTEQFKEAIFGKECGSLNQDSTKIIGAKLDNSGLFGENNELSKIVTGFLIFECQWSEVEKRRRLNANYINNPYADVKIDPIIFSQIPRSTLE